MAFEYANIKTDDGGELEPCVSSVIKKEEDFDYTTVEVKLESELILNDNEDEAIFDGVVLPTAGPCPNMIYEESFNTKASSAIWFKQLLSEVTKEPKVWRQESHNLISLAPRDESIAYTSKIKMSKSHNTHVALSPSIHSPTTLLQSPIDETFDCFDYSRNGMDTRFIDITDCCQDHDPLGDIVDESYASNKENNLGSKANKPMKCTDYILRTEEKYPEKLPLLTPKRFANKEVIFSRESTPKEYGSEKEETRKRRKSLFPDVILPTVKSENETQRKRIWNKRHCCLYCDKYVLHVSRHYQRRHYEKEEVKRLLLLPQRPPKAGRRRRKNDDHILLAKYKEREDGFTLLLRHGNFYHNCSVLFAKKGELILTRQPSKLEMKRYSYVDYTPCWYCLGFFLRKSLSLHTRTCVGVCKELRRKREAGFKEDLLSKSQALLGTTISICMDGDFYQNIVANMKDDDITETVKNDQLILELGAFLYEKLSGSHIEHIRQSMRVLARFLVEMKALNDKIEVLSDCFNAQYFHHVISAVEILCVFENKNLGCPNFKKTSLLSKIEPLFKKTATLYAGQCLRNMKYKDAEMQAKALDKYRQTRHFLTLMEMNWRTQLSTSVLSNLKQHEYNAEQLLSVTKDLIEVKVNVDSKIEKLMEEFKVKIDVKKYRLFEELLFTSIMLSNKKRSVEIASMKRIHYEKRPIWCEDTAIELKSTLTALERKLGETHVVLDIGDENKIVPVILTEKMQEYIEFLLEHRQEGNINCSNPFIFAIAGFDCAHLRGHDCLQKLCKELILEKPSFIQEMRLRKYVMTVMQILNLTENGTDWLARYLDYDRLAFTNLHMLYESAVKTTKLCRILLALDAGQINQFTGKRLSEINLNELPVLDGENVDGTLADKLSNEQPIEKQAPAVFDSCSFDASREVGDEGGPSVEDLLQYFEFTCERTVIKKRIAKRSAQDELDVPESTPKSKRQERRNHLDEEDSTSKESSHKELDPVLKTKGQKRRKAAVKKQIHIPWSVEEQNAITSFFKTQIRNFRSIGLLDAQMCIDANKTSLKNRNRNNVKVWYFNHLKRLRRLLNNQNKL